MVGEKKELFPCMFICRESSCLLPRALLLALMLVLSTAALLPLWVLASEPPPPPQQCITLFPFYWHIFLCLQNMLKSLLSLKRGGESANPNKISHCICFAYVPSCALLLSHLECLKEYSMFMGSIALLPKALKSDFLLEFSPEPASPGSPGLLGELIQCYS